MTHHQLGFQRPDRLDRNADNDQDRSTAHRRDVDMGEVQEDDREDSNDTEEDRTDDRDLVENSLNVIGGGLSGTDTGDTAVRLAEVVRHFNRIVLDRYIEVVEQDDQDEVDDCVRVASGREEVYETSVELFPAGCIGQILERLLEDGEHRRERHKAHCKDDRHNTRHADLDRNVSALTAVLLSADDALCVLDRNAALGFVHEDDTDNHCNEDQQVNHDLDEILIRIIEDEGAELTDVNRNSRNDTCKEDHGDAVADALLIDAVAHPDDKRGACHKGKDDDEHCEDSGAAADKLDSGDAFGLHVLQCQIISDCHERRKTERNDRGDRIELLSAVLAFLLETFQRRKRIGQKLNNDARIDVRRNAEREHGCFCKRAAGEDIQVLKEVSVACLFLHPRGHDAGIKERNRDDGSKTENHDDEQSEQNLLSDLGDTPSSLERFEHLTSPQPSRLPFRFFLLRKQRTSLPERSA